MPWRDPHTVPPEELSANIETLKLACLAEPRSADLRTCLGVAYAMNYDVDKSMDSLQEAVALDPDSFWPQLKYAELHYRLRVLNKAEEQTLKALNLATNSLAAGDRPQTAPGHPHAEARHAFATSSGRSR